MCSVFGILNIKSDVQPLRKQALMQSKKMRHRGPDWSGVWNNDRAILAHERLSIVDVNNGAQPIQDQSGRFVLAVNGEIYNHQELKQQWFSDYGFQTESDCEVIIPLFEKLGPDLFNHLNGMYAFVLFDSQDNRFLVGRDPVGIIPLYYGYDELGQLYVSSELKALIDSCQSIQEFPPGHYLDSAQPEIQCYFQRDWMEFQNVVDNPCDLETIRNTFSESVKRHLMSDVPYGALLSGGLDSSIVAALAQQFASRRIEDRDQTEAWWPRLHTFAIGLPESPDLVAAKKVADAIGSVHHSLEYTVQEGIDALRDVIYHVETYDVTTIRASTPMYLMARKIKAMGIKMVLSGEGSDEVFGGYLYFHKAPDPQAFHTETVRKVQRLHQFDCNRANKSMAAWGVEARVPFLDSEFLDLAMRINPQDKMCRSAAGEPRIEKHLLRAAFEGLIPDEVLWRQKEQFSDGVGYGWIDGIKQYAESEISDELMSNVHHRFSHNPPDSKEAYLFRMLFEELFPHPEAAKCVPGGKSTACSTPEALAWDATLSEGADPSGRAVRDVHEDGY